MQALIVRSQLDIVEQVGFQLDNLYPVLMCCIQATPATRPVRRSTSPARRSLTVRRPGTGKTSLARALAQKISIRLASRYSRTTLLEINSHSLFSRWFSESGKLVQKLFNSVNELADDDDVFVVVLMGASMC